MEQIRKYISDHGLDKVSRDRYLVYNRCYMFAYLRNTYNKTYQSIGRLFNRDHATVIHGLKIYDLFKDDKYFRSITEEIEQEFPMGVHRDLDQVNCLMYQILNQQETLILNKENNG